MNFREGKWICEEKQSGRQNKPFDVRIKQVISGTFESMKTDIQDFQFQ